MDISGSMTKDKKFLARSFFFLLYQFVRSKYENIEHAFIAHDTSAKEVNEDDFFGKGSSGGTLASTGLDKCSDGDNWPEDNDGALKYAKQLKSLAQFYGYCEIEPSELNRKAQGWLQMSNLSELFSSLVDDKFKIAEVRKKDDIWLAFQRFFGGFNE